MIDTLKLKKRLVDERQAAVVEQRCETLMRWSNETGEERFRFVNGTLPGSWSTNIAVNVRREEWKRFPATRSSKAQTVLVNCSPYLTIEGSVHKALLGHNVFGGPLEPAPAAAWYADYVCDLLGISSGEIADWTCTRVDAAEAWEFGQYEVVEEFIHSMRVARYPRRQPHLYGDTGILFGSTNVAVKAYHKGAEFQKNDWKGVRDSLGLERAEELLGVANGILRTEISVKSKRLKLEANLRADKSGGYVPEMPVVQLKREWLEALHDTEVARIVHEGKADMNTVRTHTVVNERLRLVYDVRLAELLFGVWMQLSALGEEAYKRRVPRSTFYWQRKKLEAAGVSWLGSDIGVLETNVIPLDFSFRRDSSYRLRAQAAEVTAALASYMHLAA